MPSPGDLDAARAARAANRTFYDALWSTGYLVAPHRFNTWPALSALAGGTTTRLEVGPGLRPRLPVRGTHFVDVSGPAVARLREGGGLATVSDVTTLLPKRRSLPALRMASIALGTASLGRRATDAANIRQKQGPSGRHHEYVRTPWT